jgi:UDP-glucuronate 4-epimerase
MPHTADADTDKPLSPYAASKKAAEAFSHAYRHVQNLEVSMLRYFTVYGPAGRRDMESVSVDPLDRGRPIAPYGNGTESPDMTYIDGIARGTMASLGLKGYQIINLGSDSPVVMSDCLGYIEDQFGRKALIDSRPAHPTDVKAVWADNSLARELLGWQPTQDWRNGIWELVVWYGASDTDTSV